MKLNICIKLNENIKTFKTQILDFWGSYIFKTLSKRRFFQAISSPVTYVTRLRRFKAITR